MKNKIGVLLGAAHDLSAIDVLFEDKSEVVYFANERYVYDTITDREIIYLYHDVKSVKEDINHLYKFVDHWYRDELGNDLSVQAGISHAQLFSQTLRTSLANIVKNYHALQKIKESVDTLYVSDKESDFLIRLFNALGITLQFYSGASKSKNPYLTSTPRFTRIESNQYPNIHKLSKIARFLQKPFLRYIKKKKRVLVIQDWTYERLLMRRSDTLSINKLLLWKSYYFKNPSNIISIFPRQFNEDLVAIDRLITVLEQQNININQQLLKLFIDEIQYTADVSYNNINRAYTVMIELLDYYQPKSIIVPASSHYAYIILMYLSRCRGMQSYEAPDGYFSWLRTNRIARDDTQTGFLCDKFFCFGQSTIDLYLKFGVSSSKLVQIEPPITNSLKKNIKKQADIEFDIIYILPFPDPHNPQSRGDYSFSIISKVIMCFIEVGYKRIGIKIKSSWDEIDIHLLKKYIPDEYFENIRFVSDKMHSIIHQCDTFVGSVTSTSMIEVLYLKKHFYGFDVSEFGFYSEILKISVISDMSYVAMNIAELKYNLENKRSVLLDNEYTYQGRPISSVTIS